MLRDLQQYFIDKGWCTTSKSLLLGGFKLFVDNQNRWQYQWTVFTSTDTDKKIPTIIVEGDKVQSLDEVCAILLQKLKQHEKDSIAEIVELNPAIDSPEFVDWNQYTLDQLADYLYNKHRFSSSGEAMAIHKLIEFYNKNKQK